jgi:hypothetical protein
MALRVLVEVGTKLTGMELVKHSQPKASKRRVVRPKRRQSGAASEPGSLRFNYTETVRIYTEQQLTVNAVYTQAGLLLTVATAVVGIGLGELAKRVGERATARPPTLFERIIGQPEYHPVPFLLRSETFIGGLTLLYLAMLALLVFAVRPKTIWNTPRPGQLLKYLNMPEGHTMEQVFPVLAGICDYNEGEIEKIRGRVYYRAAPVLPLMVVYLATGMIVAR